MFCGWCKLHPTFRWLDNDQIFLSGGTFPLRWGPGSIICLQYPASFMLQYLTGALGEMLTYRPCRFFAALSYSVSVAAKPQVQTPPFRFRWNDTVGFLWQARSTQTHTQHLFSQVCVKSEANTLLNKPLHWGLLSLPRLNFEVMWSDLQSDCYRLRYVTHLFTRLPWGGGVFKLTVSVRTEPSISLGLASCCECGCWEQVLPVHVETAYSWSVVGWFYSSRLCHMFF